MNFGKTGAVLKQKFRNFQKQIRSVSISKTVRNASYARWRPKYFLMQKKHRHGQETEVADLAVKRYASVALRESFLVGFA